MYQLLQGDNREALKALPDQSVHCIVTSPPYFGLRDYGVDGQIGLEETPAAYVAELVTVFRECWRVLRDDGTLWCNLGDSYAGSGKGGQSDDKRSENWQPVYGNKGKTYGLKPKDLIGIPWRVAFALQDDGWYLRSDIIWHKPNPMPESVTDRPTKAHEYIFLLTKSQRYYYDSEAVKEPAVKGAAGSEFHTGKTGIHQLGRSSTKPRSKADSFKREGSKREQTIPGQGYGTHRPDREESDYDLETRNRRSVWTVPTSPYPGAHFATFPPALIEPCVLAGTSAHGVCSECGAPWERIVERGERLTIPRLIEGREGENTKMNGPSGWNSYKTTGFAPTCTCNLEGINYAADDMEIIETPTGERVADDPTMQTGRKGLNRPRGENEGRRPITRYEQRQYAMQLRNSDYREHMEHEAGSAFAHYIRTDASGARPVPGDMLDSWIAKGWVERVAVPTFTPYPVVPATVLDPFNGSGTTGAVACAHNRNYIGIDLSAAYIELAHDRIREAINASGRAYVAPVCKIDDFADMPLFQ